MPCAQAAPLGGAEKATLLVEGCGCNGDCNDNCGPNCSCAAAAKARTVLCSLPAAPFRGPLTATERLVAVLKLRHTYAQTCCWLFPVCSKAVCPKRQQCPQAAQQGAVAPGKPVAPVNEPYLAPGVGQPRSSTGWIRWDLASPVLVMLGIMVHAILEGLAIGLSVSLHSRVSLHELPMCAPVSCPSFVTLHALAVALGASARFGTLWLT